MRKDDANAARQSFIHYSPHVVVGRIWSPGSGSDTGTVDHLQQSAIWHGRRLPRISVHPARSSAENGDGQTFRTADGRAQLSIYGAYNASADTPQSYLDNYFDFQGAVVGLKRATARFYVVSGTRDKNLFYERCNFPPRHDDVIDCLTITYPAADKAAWDAVVARVSRSLRNGRDLAPRR